MSDFKNASLMKVIEHDFVLEPKHLNVSPIPFIIIGSKNKACEFIYNLNVKSKETRTTLNIEHGKLIPFKMIDVNSLYSIHDLPDKIKLLFVYSETYNRRIESIFRRIIFNVVGIGPIRIIYLQSPQKIVNKSVNVHRFKNSHVQKIDYKITSIKSAI